MPRKKAKRKVTVQDLERTLKGFNSDSFWNRVIARVSPKADANALVRARSLGKASQRVCD